MFRSFLSRTPKNNGVRRLNKPSKSAVVAFETLEDRTVPAIAFSETFAGYLGNGFEPSASPSSITAAGRLNSNFWSTTGWSDGAVAVGGTATTANDFGRGTLAAATTTGGTFAFTATPGGNGTSLMFQPTGSDFTLPGTITLRLQNDSTGVGSINVDYDLFVRNDNARDNSFNLSYLITSSATPTGSFTNIPAVNYSTPGTADGLGYVLAGHRSTSISSITLNPNEYVYLRWTCSDGSGSGNRDEIGIDNIVVSTTALSGATTVTTLDTFSSATVNFGDSVTFSGTIVAQSGSLTPTGTVEIRNGGASGTLLASTTEIGGSDVNGTFNFSSSMLPVGVFTNVQAFYVAGSGFQSSSSSSQGLTVSAIPFTAGSIVAVQTDETDNNSTFAIVEVNSTTAGQAAVNGFAINGTSGLEPLRMSASAASTGYLSNSNFGGLVSFTGANTTDTANNVNTILPRGVGSLNHNGVFTFETSYLGINGNQTRSSTSIDESTWYIADQGGIYTNDATSPSPAGNFRATKAFGTTVYVGIQSAGPTDIQVSTISAPGGGTIDGLPGLTNDNTMQDFYLIRSGDNGPTFDVLYVVSNTSASAGTIAKYSLVSGSWTANGTYTTTFGGFSLAAADDGAGALLYVTSGTGGIGGNSILKLADTAGYNAAINISTPSNVTLYTAPITKVLKGVAFAPQSVTVVLPTVTMPTSSTITVSSAILGGTIASDGNALLTERGIVYAEQSVNANPQIGGTGVTVVPEGGTSVGAFTKSISGLLPATTYAYTAYATNSEGTGYTVAGTFTTAAAIAIPNVTSPTASAIGSSTATVGGDVTSDGGATVSQRGFVYAETAINANPELGGTGVNVVFVSGTTGLYTGNLSSLASAAAYSFKAFATNSAGTGYSAVGSFTTVTATSTIIPAGGVTPLSGSPGLTSFTFTAEVTASSGILPPTAGTVEFRNGGPTGTLLATATSAGSTTSSTTRTFVVSSTSVPVGTYSDIHAYYIAGVDFEDSNTAAPFGSTLTIAPLSGPIAYATPGSTYTQNFDSLPTSPTPATPIDGDSTIDLNGLGAGPFELSAAPFNAYQLNGWYGHKLGGSVADLRSQTDNGSTSGGSLNNYGILSSTERALGSVGSSSVIARFGARFVNTTGATLNEFTINYFGEQWRSGGNTNVVGNTLTFGYQLGGSSIATGSFQPVTALNFVSIHLSTTALAYDGNLGANRVAKTATITGINWAPGQELVIRWDDADDAGQDDGLAIDDFSFSAVAAAPTAPVITSPTSAQFITGLPVSTIVAASGVPAPTFAQSGLPGWLTLNAATGELSGTAPAVTVPTQYTFDIIATNGVAPADTKTFTFTVVPTKISYTTPSSNYTQNFDGMPNAGVFTLSGSGPLDLQAAPISSTNLYGWSFAVDPAQAVKYTVDNGASNTGSTMSYGTTASSDRALGGLASGSQFPVFGATFTNDTGSTLDQFTVSYTGEQWRRGNSAANVLSFSYQINGTDIRTGTFTPVAGLDFTAPVTTGADLAIDGNDSAHRTAISFTATGITWAPGETLIIRWSDANETGNDDGLAIDDLTFSASAALVAPSVTSVTPAIGPTTGGTLVSIIGSNFVSITSVTFDGFAAISFSIVSATEISATTAAHVGAGEVEVVVTNAAGSGSLAGTTDFTFAPSVSSIEVNGGPDVTLGNTSATASLAGQHSVVKQILVTFHEAVTVASDAFIVTPVPVNPSGGAGFVKVNGGASPSTNAATTSVTMLTASTYLVTFIDDSADPTPSTHGGGVLNSGVYDLTTIASKVTANGVTMAADRTDTFFALFGNIEANNLYNNNTLTVPVPAGYSSGDGLTKAFVDPGSLFRFSDAFGSLATAPAGPPAYDVVFDANLDGAIDPGDLFAFSDTFGIDWTF